MKNKLLRDFVKYVAAFVFASAAYIGTIGSLWLAFIWAFVFGWLGYNIARWVLMWLDERRRRRDRIHKLRNSTAAELEKRNILRCASGFAEEIAYNKAHRNDHQCIIIKGCFGGTAK